jgi:hypothetical protein
MNETGHQAVRSLSEWIAAELAKPVPDGARALADAIRARHGDAVRGVLFYGSCLRRDDDREGVLDLYVLVDGYRRAYGAGAYGSAALAAINALLPPNVFYVEARCGGRTVRAKYAVLSLDDLAIATSEKTLEPYFWARFAQPCALVFAATPEVTCAVTEALANAVRTFVRAGLALAPERFGASELWTAMLRASYRCEVRAERSDAADALVRFAPERYAAVTRLALASLPVPAREETSAGEPFWTVELPPHERRLGRARWQLRRVAGKSLFLLRLLRNALIFEGGVEYVIWKVERHSGSTVDPSWRESRFRLFALGAEVVRQYRRGAFR